MNVPRAVPPADLALMRRIDALHLEYPFAGSRMLQGLLLSEGHVSGRLHVATLMKRMGMDITYLPMARGFVYHTAVVDWFSRKVLAWRLHHQSVDGSRPIRLTLMRRNQYCEVVPLFESAG